MGYDLSRYDDPDPPVAVEVAGSEPAARRPAPVPEPDRSGDPPGLAWDSAGPLGEPPPDPDEAGLGSVLRRFRRRGGRHRP